MGIIRPTGTFFFPEEDLGITLFREEGSHHLIC